MGQIRTVIAWSMVAAALALAAAGCSSSSTSSPQPTSGSSATSTAEETVGGPTTAAVETPSAVVETGGSKLAEYEAGKRDVAQSGCLACHKIGESGNEGPGPDLTKVGDRLPPQAIARTLENPTAPMPSFAKLPHAKFRAIVTFLAQLK